MIPPEVYYMIALMFTLAGAVWSLSIWIAGGFTRLRDRMDRMEENILDKLLYHERHDDQRFDNVHQDLIAIKLRNAARDGLTMYPSNEKETIIVKPGT